MSQRMRSTSQIILLSFQRGVVNCFDYSFYISLNGNTSCLPDSSNDYIISLDMLSTQTSEIFKI